MQIESSVQHPASDPIDLRHLDATLTNLRAAGRDVAEVVAFIAEARDRLVAAPDDVEARQAVRMAELRMRSAVSTMAQNFAAMAKPGETAP